MLAIMQWHGMELIRQMDIIGPLQFLVKANVLAIYINQTFLILQKAAPILKPVIMMKQQQQMMEAVSMLLVIVQNLLCFPYLQVGIGYQ